MPLHAEMVERRAENDQVGGCVTFQRGDHAVFIFVDALTGSLCPAGVTADAGFEIELADVDCFGLCAIRFHAFEQGLEDMIGAAGGGRVTGG